MSEAKIPNYMKFVLGGLSGMCAIAVAQPLDLLKTRMQMSADKKEFRSSWHALTTVVGKEGPMALYNGLSASLLRQAIYGSIRLGGFTYMTEAYQNRYHQLPTMQASVVQGIVAGGGAAFFGVPADVALIRMSSDGRLPPAERRNYKNAIDALIRIAREEGVLALWSGCVPTIGRAMIVNVTQLASYAQFKKHLQKEPINLKDGFQLHVCASSMSGLLTSLASLPLDIAKTRIQNQKTKVYNGAIDAIVKISRQEGVRALWRGFTPYFSRVVPVTVLTLVFLEQFTLAYRHFVMGVP